MIEQGNRVFQNIRDKGDDFAIKLQQAGKDQDLGEDNIHGKEKQRLSRPILIAQQPQAYG